MIREETKMIIGMLEIAYPQHYAKLEQDHIIGQINLREDEQNYGKETH